MANLLDALIKPISPGWALRRERSRVQLAGLKRAYEAAKPSRHRPQDRSYGSGDTVAGHEVEVLRQRARHAEENHDLAEGVLDVLVGSVVGSGIQSFPMARLRDGQLATNLNAFLTDRWAEWTERPEVTRELHWSGCQRLACRSWFRDGEVFGQHLAGTVPGLQHASETPYSIELMEADRVPIDAHLFLGRGNEAWYGIDKDQWGRPVTYYVWDQPPNQPFRQLRVRREDLQEIPAAQMMHLKNTARVRQTRGVSVFASTFDRLQDLKDFEEAERIAAKMAASMVMVMKKNADGSGGNATPTELDFAYGMIFDQLGPEESIDILKNERPSNNVLTFRQSMLRGVASATGGAYSSIAKDFEGSYSSRRQEQAEQQRLYDCYRDDFIAHWVVPVYRRFALMQITAMRVPERMMRNVDRRTLDNAEHRGSGMAYIDPLKEVNAERQAVLGGLDSLTNVRLRRGNFPMRIHEQIVEERGQADADGIVFDTDAKHSLNQPAEPPPQEGDEAEDQNGNRYMFSGDRWELVQ